MLLIDKAANAVLRWRALCNLRSKITVTTFYFFRYFHHFINLDRRRNWAALPPIRHEKAHICVFNMLKKFEPSWSTSKS